MLRLKHELRKKGITNKEYADLLGVSEKTIGNKLNGTTEFIYSEIKRTKTLFPEYDLDYLFSDDSGTPAA